MANKETLEKIKNSIAEITSEPIDFLITNQTKWGPLNFESSRSDLEMIFNLCTHLETLPIEIVPENTAVIISSAIDAAKTEINKIRNFTIVNNGNPTQQKDEIISQIKRVGEQLLVATQGWIAFLAYQKGDVQQNINALNASVVKATQIVESAKTDIQIKNSELDGIISAARETAATVGVAHFTSDFFGKERSLELSAEIWLKVTAGLGIATVCVSIGSFFIPLPDQSGGAGLVQFFTSKIILLAILLMATVWCGRIYKAIKHQAAINAHKANALKSFQAFVNATSDEATKNAVLLETTRSIFSIGTTGYLEQSDSGSDSGSKVMEIVKNTTSAVKGG